MADLLKIAMNIVVAAFLVITFILITDMILIWLERKISARMQVRYGPMRVAFPENFHGWLQPVADALKLLLKEDITPAKADKAVFKLAPVIIVVPSFLLFVTVPFSAGWIVRDLNLGLLYMIAVTSVGVLAIIMGGWASNNKYALLGALRSAAQLVSYEVPLLFSLAVMVLGYGTLKMGEIVALQDMPGIFHFFPFGLIAFLVYITAATAEVNRIPFDIPEGESELVAGYHTEYTGMRFAFFFLAEYANIFAVAAIATTVFLGGWRGPAFAFLPRLAQRFLYLGYFLVKCYAIVFLLMWFRWTFPRVRVDQLMNFAWKFLLPVALVNLILVALTMIL